MHKPSIRTYILIIILYSITLGPIYQYRTHAPHYIYALAACAYMDDRGLYSGGQYGQHVASKLPATGTAKPCLCTRRNHHTSGFYKVFVWYVLRPVD